MKIFLYMEHKLLFILYIHDVDDKHIHIYDIDDIYIFIGIIVFYQIVIALVRMQGQQTSEGVVVDQKQLK